MSKQVAPWRIERIVGVERHPTEHFGRAVSAEETVYILHSHECRDSTPDLRDCPFSLALDKGIDVAEWDLDTPAALSIHNGRLTPWPMGAER